MSDHGSFFLRVGTDVPAQRREMGVEVKPPVDMMLTGGAGGARAWACTDDKYVATSSSYKCLPAGLYRCEAAPTIGAILVWQENRTDTLLRMPDSDSDVILAEIEQFNRLEPEFRKHGFMFKRGILLWGPPGSGKTCTIQLLVDLVVNHDGGIAVYVEAPGLASMCLQMIRRVEPDRQIIAILEDFDDLVVRYGDAGYLALLDGENQIDNIVYVATSNYPERLDRRFVDRPSRFDTIRYVGMPKVAARRLYLATKDPGLTESELDRYVEATEGFSIAHLRELIVLTRCFKRDLTEAIERLSVYRHCKPDSENTPDRPAFGFLARA